MDVDGPVPGYGFVGAHVVVLGAVGLDVADEVQSVVDLFVVEPFGLERAEAAFAGPVST